MKRMILSAVVLAIVMCGCLTTNVDPNAAQLTVDFSWKDVKSGSTVSPAIKVSGFPAETKYFTVKLADLDVPAFNHGGGKVENDGTGIIAAGALKDDYKGPNPPSGSHRYEFTVQAVNAEGTIIGIGKSTKKFP